MGNKFEYKKLKRKLQKLSRDYFKPVRKYLNQAGKTISSAAKANFKGTGISKELAKGISHKVWKTGTGVYIGLKKDFRLTFFEKGTKERYHKDKHYTGQIQPYFFFKSAVDNSLEAAQKIIQDGVNEQINELNKDN